MNHTNRTSQTGSTNTPATPAPWALLGLPDPDGAALTDPRLAAAYREFCGGLEADPEGRFVRADAFYLFRLGELNEDVDTARLDLLCGLYHPNGNQLRHIRSRFSDVVRYQQSRGQFEGHVYDFAELAYYRRFVAFADTPDYATLTANTVASHTVGRINGENSPGPGFTFFSELHLSRWSREWTVVLWFGDAQNSFREVFPTVYGFARRDDLERNTVALLAGDEIFRTPSTFMMNVGLSDLVSLGYYKDDEEFEYGLVMSQFTDA